MRIIAGRLRGRIFDSPHTNRTHPMSDKVRGALFNALGDLEGLTVLDAFAGSGACGIEAASRGASGVLAVDVDPEAVKTMLKNVKTLDLTDVMQVRRMGMHSWSQANPTALFDVVISDPPYDDLQPKTLESLPMHVKPGGLLVLSWPGNQTAPAFDGLEVISHKTYGDAQLIFYRES